MFAAVVSVSAFGNKSGTERLQILLLSISRNAQNFRLATESERWRKISSHSEVTARMPESIREVLTGIVLMVYRGDRCLKRESLPVD